MDIHSRFLRTDVTAVKFFEKHVIAGMGCDISVYEILTTHLVVRTNIFNGQKVHGFCIGTDKLIAVYGGRFVAVLQLNLQNEIMLSIQSRWQIDDWILCLQWLIEDKTIAIATAHNIVSLWNWKTRERLCTTHCEEKCILYSALFVGSSWQDLILLAGTVFQEIVVWSPPEARMGRMDSPVLHRLKGHQGVIFSIYYNPHTRRVYSTSDDRSVRVWTVQSSEVDESYSWRHARIELQHTLFGHTARVWRSVGLDDITISIGEDSHLCIWNADGQLLKRWMTHQGGCVWSVDCSQQENLIVTGGGDGGISLWPLQDCVQNSMRPATLTFPSNLFEGDITPPSPILRRAVLLSSGCVAAVTGSGHLLHCNVMDHERFKWSLLYFDKGLANYCLLKPSLCRRYIALATLVGRLLIFEEDASSLLPLVKTVDKMAVDGKIFSLQWLSPEHLLTCDSLGRLEMWGLVKNPLAMELKKLHEFVLPSSKERWLTSALLKDGFLVCGDRAGSIHLYHVSSGAKDPCETLYRIHDRLGVSSLASHAGDKLFSTGRDSTLRQYRVIGTHRRLQHLGADRLPMEWVAVTCDSPHGLLAAGFAQTSFVLWSQRDQRILMELSCGGGHRSWDCAVSPSLLHFIHIKEKQVHFMACPLDHLAKPVLQAGFHTREVCCLQLVHGTSCTLLVSAGEDTTIRLTTIHDVTGPQTLAVLRSHISSVRALALCRLDDTRTLLLSAGGRAQMKAWLLTIEVGEGAPQLGCHEVASHMLNSSSIRQRRPWRDALPSVDSETRYMSLSAVAVSQNSVFTIAAGCSDGLLRIFCYDVIGQKLSHMGSYTHHNHCILNVAHISPEVVLTMATDGNVAFWDITGLVQETLKHHCIGASNKQDSNNQPDQSSAEGCVLGRYKMDSKNKNVSSGHHKFEDGVLKGCDCNVVEACDVLKEPNSLCDRVHLLSVHNNVANPASKCGCGVNSSLSNDLKNLNYSCGTNQFSSACNTVKSSDSNSAASQLSSACSDYTDQNSVIENVCPFFVCQLHQSGINSHDLVHLNSRLVLLATGGDDNAITLTVFRGVNGGGRKTAEQLMQWKEPSAHSAQVTGLKLLNNIMVSASVNQRVLLWRWQCIPSQSILEAHCVRQYCSPVADVQGLLAWHHRSSLSICVYGKGMEVLCVDMLSPEEDKQVCSDSTQLSIK